jgi:hypothetical protein
MAATKAVETVLSSLNLPLELRHRSSARESEERKVVSRLSGVITARQPDEVICPYSCGATSSSPPISVLP